MKKIVLAGGTGFLGSFLASKFRASGHRVNIISTNNSNVAWKDREALVSVLDGADVVLDNPAQALVCKPREIINFV